MSGPEPPSTSRFNPNSEIGMGSTGDPPVPSGHWPDGMGRTPEEVKDAWESSPAIPVPSGESPLGTGQWPVLPTGTSAATSEFGFNGHLLEAISPEQLPDAQRISDASHLRIASIICRRICQAPAPIRRPPRGFVRSRHAVLEQHRTQRQPGEPHAGVGEKRAAGDARTMGMACSLWHGSILSNSRGGDKMIVTLF